MSYSMYQKIILLCIILLLSFSCSKKDVKLDKPNEEDQAAEVYQTALDAMEEGDFFFAANKFAEAELILPEINFSAKSLLMSSYCFYSINFYPETIKNLEKYISKYPAQKDVPYANYLIIISLYEQILDEKKDITPLLETKKKINIYLKEFPNTEYAIDLSFKLDLINNQLAAKELYVAKYYIETKKWIAAIQRLRTIVDNYNETVFIEEALYRLVEIYYNVGLEEEAKAAAILLGYNYNSSEWYEKSYKILNKNYKIPKIKKEKKNGLIKKTIERILN